MKDKKNVPVFAKTAKKPLAVKTNVRAGEMKAKQ